MDINLDLFNAGLTTLDSIATSASAFNGGPSSVSSNAPSFNEHLQQAAQQSSGGNGADPYNSATSATTFDGNVPNGNSSHDDSSSPNHDGNPDPQFTASSYLADRSRGDDRSSRTATSMDGRSRHSKAKQHDDDQASTSAGSSRDLSSAPADPKSADKSTADAATADGNKDATPIAATQGPAHVAVTTDATQAATKVTSIATTDAPTQSPQTGAKSQTAATPGTSTAAPGTGSNADAMKAAVNQQTADAATPAAAQSSSAVTDATSTTLQAATQPGLATQVAGKSALQNVPTAGASQGPAAAANVQPASIAATPVLPTPAVNPATDAALPNATPPTSKSDQPPNIGQNATVAFAAPTAGLPAALAAATLGSTTVDTSSVNATSLAEAAISKATDIKTDKGAANSAASQDATSSTSSVNGSTGGSPRSTITLAPQSSFATEQGATISATDQARFVQRVAKAFEAAGTHDGPLVVRLSPPELGSLKLEISVRDGALTANVQTDNSATRNILLDNLPALRDRLEQQDIRIERFNVEVQDRSPGGQPQLPDQNPGANDSGRRYRAANTLEAGASAEPTIQGGGLSLSGGGQLNVVI